MNLLEIYLNDHLAAVRAELALARRCRGENPDGDLATFLDRFIADLEDDDDEIGRVIETLGYRRSRIKPALAMLGERLGRLKLNGQLTGYSPLSRVLELESLSLTTEHRRNLWRSLAEMMAESTAANARFARLAERAEEQRKALEHHRLEATRRAMEGASLVPLAQP